MAMPLQSAYEQVLADLQQALAQAKEDFARAQQKVSSLQAAVREMEERQQSIVKAQSPLSVSMVDIGLPYAGLTIIEAARSFLESRGEFTDCKVIAEGIVQGGFRTKSPTFVRNVLAMLFRDWKRNPDTAFMRDRKKRWGLKAWKRTEHGSAVHDEPSIAFTS